MHLVTRLLLLPGLLLAAVSPVHAEVKGAPVEYRAGDTVLKGYLAYDDGITGKRPGVLVVHEWWGHNDYARKRADMLAELGYTALAVDMYGDGKQAEHPEDAGKFSREAMENMDTATQRFMAGMELLQSQPTTDPDRIAAIGYCFGGAVVLTMARSGVDLDGVASFHGSLPAGPVEPGTVKAKVLVLHGAADKFIPPEKVKEFEQSMQDAEVDLTIVSYPGVLHSFTNPDADKFGEKFDLPLKYDAEADQQSWAEMQAFFDTIFQQ